MMALRIVVIEDDATIGWLLAETLMGMGHDVCAIETTEGGAVAAAARHGPDLMIVDMHLAEGSGVAAMERISRVRLVPHLFISGDDQPAARNAELLRKPFREDQLAAAIARVLGLAPRLQP